MIRFLPDSLPQAFTRFFDMAAPDANVYLEIPAPDVRFAAIAVLALVGVLLWRKLGPGREATFAMVLLLLGSTAIWLYTTGNGRYFMAMLVAAGPIGIALICLLPFSRGLKASLALLLVAGQAFVLTQQPPWNSWTVLHWDRPPYFEVKFGPQEKQAPPTTYAVMSMLSYSLIAPQLPPDSRWINLAAGSVTPRDDAWSLEFLKRASTQGPLKVIAPSLPWASKPDGQPTAEILEVFNRLAARRNLRLTGECRHVASRGLIRMAERAKADAEANPDDPKALGFWICNALYEPQASKSTPEQSAPADVLAAYRKLGELCPRFFPASEPSLLRVPDGWSRHYAASETRVYVLDNGEVWYHFWRSLNPVMVGRVPDLLAGKTGVNCNNVRGSDGAWRTGAQ